MKNKIAAASLLALSAGLASSASSQTPAAPPKPVAAAYTPARTSSGQPSFEGVWTQNFVIVVEAMPQIPMLVVPEAQAKAIAAQVAGGIGGVFDKQQLDPEVPALMATTDGFPIVRGERRTRSVVMPADGKLPYTPEARKEAMRGYGTNRANNPEERPNWERCVTSLGLPPVSGMYTAGANPRQFIQTSDAVVLHTEYGDEARIIPFSTTHRPPALYTPLGDSIARWDGDTLVIETIGLREDDRVRAFSNLIVSSKSKVIERYTRVSDTELLYQYTVEDPAVFTAPWLAEYSLYRTDQRMFEHACHEGNYSLPNILVAARVKEASVAAAPPAAPAPAAPAPAPAPAKPAPPAPGPAH